MGVYFGLVEFKFVLVVDSYVCKGFVDFDDINIVQGDVVLGEEFGDGYGGVNIYDVGGEIGGGGVDVFVQDGLIEFDGGVVFYQQDGSSIIGNLRGIVISGVVILLREGGVDFVEIFGGGVRLDVFVLGQGDCFGIVVFVFDLGGDGDDFVIEKIGFLCFFGFLEIFGGVFVYYFVSDIKVSVDVFGSLIYGLYVVDSFLGVFGDFFVKGFFECIVVSGYVFGFYGDIDFDGFVGDGVGNVGDGFEVGGVEVVE